MKENNRLEEELSNLVKKIIKDYDSELTKNDFKEIVNEIIPEIDRIISMKIKEHFIELAKYILKTLE